MGDANFYVAKNGNDSWSGSLPNSNKAETDGPFATLERARDAARQQKSERNREEPLTIMLRGGTYRLPQPFVLRPEDSGSPNGPVVYTAYPGETPVISGGKALSGWKPGDAGLWTVALPEVKEGKWYPRQIFIDGQRRDRARFPSEGMLEVVGGRCSDLSNWAAVVKEENNKKSFQFKPGDIRKDWTNLKDVEVVMLQFWTAARLRIASIDDEASIVEFTGESFRPLTWSFGYYVDNVYEGLDVPGSWYLDREKGMLYYHPLPGEKMNEVEVVVPVLQQLVRLEGDTDGRNFVHNITFHNIAFHHTDWVLPEEGYAFPQGELPPSAALDAEGALNCRIEECELAHLGGWGIELGRGCQDNAIVRNTVRDVGAGCVKIGVPDPYDCKEDAEEACRTVVSDNQFLDGGHIYLGSPGVWIGRSSNNNISHNVISGAFQWGISVGWSWDYFPLTRTRENIIEFNHIHHLGTGVLGTHGAIYALGAAPGTIIRNNYIHHVFSNEHWGAGEGIILDNGCTGYRIENNLIHDAVAGGWGCNFNCLGNIIVNNIFAYGTKFQLTRYGDSTLGTPPPNGEIFSRNIVIWKEGPLFNEKVWLSYQTLWDYNLYFQVGKDTVKFMEYSFDEWKAKGLDTNSIIADPMFANPEKGDFTLAPTSPAFQLGFRPIDISGAGPQPLQNNGCVNLKKGRL